MSEPFNLPHQKGTEGLDKPQLTPGVNMIIGSGTPGEAQPGAEQDMGEEAGENADSESEAPVNSWILTRLVR